MLPVIQAWLENQCGALNGAAGAMVFLLTGNGQSLAPAAAWPRGSEGSNNLASAAKASFEQQQPMVKNLTDTGASNEDATAVVSHPLNAQGRTVGAVAVAVKSDQASAARLTLQRLALGAAAFTRLAEAPPGAQPNAADSAAGAPGNADAALVLQLMASVLAHEKFADAAHALATELAAKFGCERVSIGVSNARYIEVVALSHSTEFSSGQTLLRDLGAAMDEAVTQNSVICYPQSEHDQPRITLQHADLAKRHHSAQIVTTPLVSGARSFGAICYELAEERSVANNPSQLTADIASFIAPLLILKHAHERAIMDRALGKAKRFAGKLVGEGHIGFKLAALAVTSLIAVLAWVPATFHVSAEARIEGAVQRALVAAADGYLKETHVRPGDRVKSGQLLAELADEDLKLNRRKWASEFAQAESAYGDALAKHDRAQIVVQQARMEQARAQLELTQQEITRSQLIAPFDGVIIKGDLTQSLGAPVKRGDALLTLAPSDAYRVILEVDERDVAHVSTRAEGELALSAVTGETFPIKVMRLTPVARSEQGRHYFEVEAALMQPANALLRPGLRGVAKLPAGERSLLWSWTRRISESLRLLAWRWFG